MLDVVVVASTVVATVVVTLREIDSLTEIDPDTAELEVADTSREPDSLAEDDSSADTLALSDDVAVDALSLSDTDDDRLREARSELESYPDWIDDDADDPESESLALTLSTPD